jgi:hypothetical protein
MRKLLNLAGICLLTLAATIATIIYFAIDNQPHVERDIVVTPEHIARAKHILDTHRHQVHPGRSATAKFQSEDLDIALNYLAHHFAQGRAQIKARDNSALIRLSLPMSAGTTSVYFNLEATLVETNGLPKLKSVRVGDLTVPDRLANLLASQLLTWLQRISPDVSAGLDAFKKLQISRNEIAISYHWKGWGANNDRYSSLGAPLFNQQELNRLFHYHDFLNKKNQQQISQSISLSELLTVIMRETTQRSTHGNTLEEIRAAILVTTLHVLQFPPRWIIPEAVNWPNPVRIKVTLDERADFAKHFMASAAITAYTDTILSDAIGLYKELEDARSGSGFSFNDIAANRSGTRFAEKVMTDQASAQKVRNTILSGISDADLIPYWSDLPEHMSKNAFNTRFGGTDTPQYHAIMEKIERRVASLKLLR